MRILFGSSPPDDDVQLCRGSGCSQCYQSGYLGRQSVYEILSVSRRVQRMIIDKVDDDAIKAQAVSEGMRTLRMAAVGEVLAGRTTIEEIMRVVDMERG